MSSGEKEAGAQLYCRCYNSEQRPEHTGTQPARAQAPDSCIHTVPAGNACDSLCCWPPLGPPQSDCHKTREKHQETEPEVSHSGTKREKAKQEEEEEGLLEILPFHEKQTGGKQKSLTATDEDTQNSLANQSDLPQAAQPGTPGMLASPQGPWHGEGQREGVSVK